MCLMSEVAPDYAPDGRSLVSVSLGSRSDSGVAALEPGAREQLADWFGPDVDHWRFLRGYSIPRALPAQPVGVLDPAERSVRVREGLYVCGDHVDNGSIQGAMVSGRRAAEALLEKE